MVFRSHFSFHALSPSPSVYFPRIYLYLRRERKGERKQERRIRLSALLPSPSNPTSSSFRASRGRCSIAIRMGNIPTAIASAATAAATATTAPASALTRSGSTSRSGRRRTRRNDEERREASRRGASLPEDRLHVIPGRIFSNEGRSCTASIYTQQGRKGINQDAMLLWEVRNEKAGFFFFFLFA